MTSSLVTGALLQWAAVHSEIYNWPNERTGDCWVLNPIRDFYSDPSKVLGTMQKRRQKKMRELKTRERCWEMLSSAHDTVAALLNSLQSWLHRK